MLPKNKKIYMDYAATTPVDPEVLQVMLPFFKEKFGNPSSVHSPGQQAKKAIDRGRERVAQFLNCSPSEIVFTGSATEADNMAILGAVKAAHQKGIKNPHIITTKIEHKAVLKSCQVLEKLGTAEVSYLPVTKQGPVRMKDVKNALQDNTVLVSVMYANNEIGTIQSIAEIGKLLKKRGHSEGGSGSDRPKNPDESARNAGSFAIAQDDMAFPLFHTDAVQAINYLDCDVERLGVDLLTLSGHKIYGPKGVGALYVKQRSAVEPLIYGGGQEQGKRGGTENVPGIVGLGAAIKKVNSQDDEQIKRLRDKLIDGVIEKIPDSQLNGSRENRLPNNINFSFPGAEGEAIVIALDQEGIAASTGSACSSQSLKPSYVLTALGLSKQQAHSSLRLTLGRWTTEQDIDKVLEVLPKIVKRLRKISGN